MADASQYMFPLKEVTEILIRRQGLKDGIWQIIFQFGLTGAVLPSPTGEATPAAIVPVLSVGLQKVDKESSIAIDASKLSHRSGPKTEALLCARLTPNASAVV